MDAEVNAKLGKKI